MNEPRLVVPRGDLERSDGTALEEAPFGVIGMNAAAEVEVYNLYESRLSGLSATRVVGKHFFSAVAPCTNNYLVAQRFEEEPTLDAIIDYGFTLKMKPTKVRVRLLKSPEARRMYLLVEGR